MKIERKIVNVVKYYKEFNRKEIIDNGVGVEIQDFTDPNLPKDEIEMIINFYKEEFKGLDCILGMHGPFIDLNPSSPDLDIKRISYEKYLDVLRIAGELEMDYIVYHSQINDGHIEPNMKEFVMETNHKLWRDLLRDVPEFKGMIVIENIFEKHPDMLKFLIKAVDLENVKVNLDIGHAKLGNVELEVWIRELKDYIHYMHIHSNNGKYDQHQPPSREEVDNLYGLLDKYDISPVLSLEYAKDNLKDELKKYR